MNQEGNKNNTNGRNGSRLYSFEGNPNLNRVAGSSSPGQNASATSTFMSPMSNSGMSFATPSTPAVPSIPTATQLSTPQVSSPPQLPLAMEMAMNPGQQGWIGDVQMRHPVPVANHNHNIVHQMYQPPTGQAYAHNHSYSGLSGIRTQELIDLQPCALPVAVPEQPRRNRAPTRQASHGSNRVNKRRGRATSRSEDEEEEMMLSDPSRWSWEPGMRLVRIMESWPEWKKDAARSLNDFIQRNKSAHMRAANRISAAKSRRLKEERLQRAENEAKALREQNAALVAQIQSLTLRSSNLEATIQVRSQSLHMVASQNEILQGRVQNLEYRLQQSLGDNSRVSQGQSFARIQTEGDGQVSASTQTEEGLSQISMATQGQGQVSVVAQTQDPSQVITSAQTQVHNLKVPVQVQIEGQGRFPIPTQALGEEQAFSEAGPSRIASFGLTQVVPTSDVGVETDQTAEEFPEGYIHDNQMDVFFFDFDEASGDQTQSLVG
ncbi:hypothetical protein F5Y11DRAFT_344179 [Daldinia sp. FL1419]|nr:hypothetical protein F5Y11DRAFT_344179 [Daldinia sp. FL1419]